ncbi:MAG: hypothetical protein GVY10_05875 [Verrucomicrobia bacterium]|jgi:hypothetical protein|nr:hypothetical protein [Verrucomicrobiota bacterium]
MSESEQSPEEMSPKAQRHRNLLIVITVLMVLLPLFLGALHLLGVF